ncbi:LytR family transcriptional regulator [Epidermidibacterium keratini]|uniref:LytR family transcriptional regulator n=1 Tax=Epidermidibacterium keratini TaxID=1891644 RepID=A0A7L4YRQ6_9ACTN|nr:LCP family protein [Epidermidibacterium keratini]QHC01469.1 LytR family transcriptional regulator [Epidermidibacterium keratini]
MAKHNRDDDDSLSFDEIAGPAADDSSVSDEVAGSTPAKRRGFFARHKVFTVFLVLIGLIVGSVVGFGLYLNGKLSDVATYTSSLKDEERVEKYTAPNATGPAPINILLLGADKTSGKSVSELIAAGQWDVGSMRSDTIMLVHIPSDRSQIQLVSFPRDSWVPVPGQGTTKINAAFSYGGPDLAIQTVEQLTQVYIDHLMIVDWDGFKGITDALGGVTLYVPGQGSVKMNGDEALDYVRERKDLPGGDFDRIKRQQNFLRQIMKQTVDSVSFTNIGMMLDLLSVITQNVTVDAGMTPEVMRSMAWDLRGVKSSNVTFMTVPTTGTGTEGDQSVVYIDDAKAQGLYQALREDTMTQYLSSTDADTLGDETSIN